MVQRFFCNDLWAWASQLVCSKSVCWDGAALPGKGLTPVCLTNVIFCEMPWYGKSWKSTVKACSFSSRENFISLCIYVYTYKNKIVLCNYSYQNLCYTKDLHLALIEPRALANILVSESGYKRNQGIWWISILQLLLDYLFWMVEWPLSNYGYCMPIVSSNSEEYFNGL